MSTGASPETIPTTNGDLQVPGEPGVYFCARHKSVKTRLRCGRCETPICPKCTKYGPTGARCAACASNRSSHMYQVSPLQFLLAFGVAFGCSMLGALLASFALLVVIYALVAGNLIAKAIIRVVHGKRGIPLAVVASLGVAAGAMVPLGILFGGSALGNVLNPFIWLYIVLTIVGIWNWLK